MLRLEDCIIPISGIRHLRVFGSTCYALIPKEQRNKLGARSRKCIFLGYEENSKAYRLYDEVNKKFVISRDDIFLETTKNDQSIERQLDRLEKYPHPKKYSENEYEIPNLEGGDYLSDGKITQNLGKVGLWVHWVLRVIK